MSELGLEQYALIGRYIYSLVYGEAKLRHADFKILTSFIVEILHSHEEMSVRDIESLTDVAIGHIKEGVERLETLGFLCIEERQRGRRSYSINSATFKIEELAPLQSSFSQS